MSIRFRAAGAFLSVVLGLVCAQAARAAEGVDVDTLARDVDRLTSLRQVKDLQRSYAQYAQSGQWNEMARLFTDGATFIRGSETLSGRKAIADWLTRRGGGKRGLPAGALHTEFIDQPLANLSVDGRSAKARWMSMTLLADGKGNARIEGGIYENEYVREGQAWKISVSHYYAQYSGSYEDGWVNEGNADLPIIPYHFTVDESGVAVPPATGTAPHSNESLASLMQKIDRLNDEDSVRNLQHAYGYYIDRKMWDDVVDLFTKDATVEIKGTGTFRGPRGVREVMEKMGPTGLQHGQLNDHPLFDTIVQVLPGGHEALSRGIDLGMIGEADKGTARWELSVFRNRFVKADGVWKLEELHVYPLMNADYFKGWGREGVARNVSLPPMLGSTVEKSAGSAGTKASNDVPQLAEASRRFARSMAYDGTENVSAAYGYYIDDFQWPAMGAIFAEHGSKQSPFAGYYFGRERISKAATTMYGSAPAKARAGIAFHWRTQPVINISADGRSANLRTRLFHPDTGKQSAAGRPDIMSGMYPNDQTVLENGVWRLWSLEIDEPYFTMDGWKRGWSGVKDKPPGSPRPPLSPLVAKMAPDILMTELGRRADGFRGGTGETVEWPGILPMWFNYRNPVSGREPPLYWPDCVPCELKPEARMTQYGYQMPPTGPKNVEGVTPAISGVVDAGTPIRLVKDGYEAVEGPIPQPDGGLLFTNNRANHIEHIAPDGSASVWYQGTGGANALTRTLKGEIAATLIEDRAIGIVHPGEAPHVLVGDYEGTRFNRPNDLVANRRGDIYFTDTVSITATGPAAMPSALYQWTAKGKLVRIANDVARPNGVALSPDERTLYLANTSGEWVYAFGLDENGQALQRRDFAQLVMPTPQKAGAAAGAGADGLAVDEKGRLYVATTVGVQVFSPDGARLGIITLPKQPQNLAFSGPGRKALFVVGRGSVYRIDTLTRGRDRASK